MTKKLDPAELKNLILLFENKKWEIDEDNKSSLFNRFVNRYSELRNVEEREAFLALAEKYCLVDLKDYLDVLLDILNRIFEFNEERQDILVMPLLAQDNISRIKSSSFVCYLFNHTALNYYDRIRKKIFTIVDNYDILGKKLKPGKTLFLVDDYIGSGNQSLIALNDIISYIENLPSLNIDDIEKIYIISLYIHEKGISLIEEEIKDKKTFKLIYGQKTKYNIEKYKDILSGMNIKDGDNTFEGYKNCGDLITLVRTPNNTIPLFRKNKNAPFQRK